MDALKEIPLNAVTPSVHNPRRIAKGDPAIAELAASIKANGLLQPVVCRKQADGYELLAGRRRYEACLLNGAETILAIVRDLDDQAAIQVTVLENLQREDLTPMEEARGVKSLLDAGADAKTVADEIGRSVQWVARRRALCKLSPKWMKLLEEGKTSIGHAELAAGFPAAVQDSLLNPAWQIDPDRLDAFRTRIAQDAQKLSAAPWDMADTTLGAPGKPHSCACVKCQRRASVQPELWAEDSCDAKHDRCLDAACWAAKLAEWTGRAEAAAREKHPNLILVQTAYNPNGNGEERGILREYQFERAKKPGPGVFPALVTYGPSFGKVILAKPVNDARKLAARSARGVDGKVPLKERQEQLANRRGKWVIEQVAEALQRSTLDRDDTVCPVDGKPELVIALAAAFGTDERNDSANPKTWTNAGNFHKARPDAIRHLWRMVAGVLQNRLRLWGGDCARQYADAMEIRALLAMPSESELMAEAVKALPEPRAWAAEIAAAQASKAKKTKRGKKNPVAK